MKKAKSAADRLKEMAGVNESKGKDYGRFEKIGDVLAAYFPNGITLNGSDEFNRFILFAYMANKLVRTSDHLPSTIHEDSILDASVYGAILLEVNELYK